jgi:hypothetical protein
MSLFFLAQQPPVDKGLFIHEDSRSLSDTPQSVGSSGRVISSSQRPITDNTQHSQRTDIHAPLGFEPTIPAGERPQTYALDRAPTGTGDNDEQLEEIIVLRRQSRLIRDNHICMQMERLSKIQYISDEIVSTPCSIQKILPPLSMM